MRRSGVRPRDVEEKECQNRLSSRASALREPINQASCRANREHCARKTRVVVSQYVP